MLRRSLAGRRLAPLGWFILLLGLPQVALADKRGEVEGIWASGGSLLRVAQVGETLSMHVVALEEPVDAAGQPFLDVENPDPALRSEPLLGMDILSDYRFKGGRWAAFPRS